jgi:hypothetical protein
MVALAAFAGSGSMSVAASQLTAAANIIKTVRVSIRHGGPTTIVKKAKGGISVGKAGASVSIDYPRKRVA